MPQHYRLRTLMLNASSKPSSKQSLHLLTSSLKSLSRPSLVTHLIVWMTPWYCSLLSDGVNSTIHLRMPTRIASPASMPKRTPSSRRCSTACPWSANLGRTHSAPCRE